jgi:hypothetical protein
LTPSPSKDAQQPPVSDSDAAAASTPATVDAALPSVAADTDEAAPANDTGDDAADDAPATTLLLEARDERAHAMPLELFYAAHAALARAGVGEELLIKIDSAVRVLTSVPGALCKAAALLRAARHRAIALRALDSYSYFSRGDFRTTKTSKKSIDNYGIIIWNRAP